MYCKANGINLYYKKSGNGSPVIMLHGNGETCAIFTDAASEISKNHTVYIIDSRCHGKSEKTNTLSYTDMAEDIAQFIMLNNIEKPVLYGFSDGGIVGLLIASKHPSLLGKLIVSGANSSLDGVSKPFVMSCRIKYFFTKDLKLRLMGYEPNMTDEDLKKIKIPVVLLAGENDMIKLSHTKYLAETIPNAEMKIIENEDHGSYVIDNKKLLKILMPLL